MPWSARVVVSLGAVLALISNACEAAPGAEDTASSGRDATFTSVEAGGEPSSAEPPAKPDADLDDTAAELSPEASGPGLDAGDRDASADAGPPAQPTASDAAPADATSYANDAAAPHDAALPQEAGSGSNVITVTTQGTRCLNLIATNVAPELCPEQACFSDQNQIVARVEDGSLLCRYGASCPYPDAEDFAMSEQDEGRTRNYEYRGAELQVMVAFRTLLLKDFTLEGMRKYVRYAAAGGMLTVNGRRELITGGAEATDVEFVSYAAGRLRMRIQALVHGYNQRIDTIPHLCPGAHTLPTICEHTICWWGTEHLAGSGLPPRISLDVTIPIQPYDP